MTESAVPPPVRVERAGAALILTLDRPKALNALNLEMIDLLEPALRDAADDPAIALVVIEGAGGRAFCAGGDVRAVALSLQEPGSTFAADFFRAEYRLNHMINRYPKPFVALVDGICMGGGLGLSVHGSHRVVTERLVLAMPETGIGLFPDVGGGWFLNRWPGGTGTYAALTGARLDAADAVHVGYATHLVPSERLGALRDRLIADAPRDAASVDAVLAEFVMQAGQSALAELRPPLDDWFAADAVEDVIARLSADGSAAALKILDQLASKSPTSLKISLALMRRAIGMTIEQDLAVEFRMSQHCMTAPDFYEGIRALLIDKDNAPKWNPLSLEAINACDIDQYFGPCPAGELDLGQ